MNIDLLKWKWVLIDCYQCSWKKLSRMRVKPRLLGAHAFAWDPRGVKWAERMLSIRCVDAQRATTTCPFEIEGPAGYTRENLLWVGKGVPEGTPRKRISEHKTRVFGKLVTPWVSISYLKSTSTVLGIRGVQK
jgi:hypothetical protein